MGNWEKEVRDWEKRHTFRRAMFAIGIVLAVIVFAVIMTHTESFKREMKSFRSDYTGGLDRTVTVYAYNGEVIKSYTGKFDVTESEDEVYFDVDGKRVIIHGGIVINEEN